jgi:hypothetical protein
MMCRPRKAWSSRDSVARSTFCECEKWGQQGFKQGHQVVSLCFPELAIKLTRVEEMCFTRSCGSCSLYLRHDHGYAAPIRSGLDLSKRDCRCQHDLDI